MSVKLLLREFERIGDQSDAVPRLRDFVRKLAVSGNLSPTEPTEWSDCTLDDVGAWGSGGTPLKGNYDYYGGEIPWLVIGDLNDGLVTTAASTISELGLANSSAKMVEPGTVLVAMYGSIGKLGLAGIRCATNQAIAYCAVNPARVTAEFLMVALRSMRRDLLARGQGGTQPNISQTILKAWPINLPPLAEQYRIVARVDELMTLCDQLEAAQNERELHRDALRSVSLHRLASTDDDAGTTADVRFFLDTSPRLITRTEHVAAVRQTILDLAVRGRLVPHDSEDGNGYELVTKISSSRQGAGARTPVSLEGVKSLPSLPDTWTWATIDEISSVEAGAITDGPFGANLKTADYVVTLGFRVVRLENIGHGSFRNARTTYITREHWERLAKHHVFAGDLVVAGLVDPSVRACEVPRDIGPALVKADCYRFHVHPEFATHFALYYLNSPLCQDFAAVHHHGMTLTRLGLGNFRRLPIPVPPLAEQHRIVAKVDELMAVYDELEAALASAQFERGRLLEALLHDALNESRRPMASAQPAVGTT